MPAHSTYDFAVVEAICERVANGETVAEVCRDLGVWRRTFDRWCDAHDEAKKLRDEAFKVGNEAILDECMEIMDNSRNDWIERRNARTGAKEIEFNSENVQRSKLRVWGRLEILARRDPARYGAKQTIDHRGKVSLESLVASAGQPKASDPE
jgi:transposase-like protein